MLQSYGSVDSGDSSTEVESITKNEKDGSSNDDSIEWSLPIASPVEDDGGELTPMGVSVDLIALPIRISDRPIFVPCTIFQRSRK